LFFPPYAPDTGAGLLSGIQSFIAADVKTDTRKLDSLDAFTKGVTVDTEEQGFRGPRRSIGLKNFVEQRRTYLLNHPAVKQTRV